MKREKLIELCNRIIYADPWPDEYWICEIGTAGKVKTLLEAGLDYKAEKANSRVIRVEFITDIDELDSVYFLDSESELEDKGI